MPVSSGVLGNPNQLVHRSTQPRMEQPLLMSSGHGEVSIPMSQRNTSDIPRNSASDQETLIEGPLLSFHNICYRVKVKSGSLLNWKTTEKEILSNINGIMKPGLNAIMGPTGGGKSLLLDILAARKDPRGLSGDILINGAPRPANFKSNSGYVVRDGLVLYALTVRENIQFAAALRLPATMTNHEKNERVNRLIGELGLSDVADVKGYSIIEMKRTSIAMELITDPPFLFLDEPTNGLDSRTATAVLLLLKRMSKEGRTIIFSIHRPRYAIFRLFNSLTLMASGKLLFHGPAQKAVQYFRSAGYPCESQDNLADFFLDILSRGCSSATLNRGKEDPEAIETEELVGRERSALQMLSEFYTNSSFYKETKAVLDQLLGSQRSSLACEEITCATPVCHQFRWITWRSLRNFWAFPWVTISQMFLAFFLALVVGATFLGLKTDCTEIQYRVWSLYVITAFQCFTSVTAGEIFEIDKNFFIHEYISGYYRIPCYFIGKLLCEFVPRRLIPTTIFNVTLYFMIGLKPGAEAFFIMMVTVLMVAYSTSSMALILGAGTFSLSTETFLVTMYLVFMLVFLGMSMNLGSMAPWISWVEYLSIPHYSYKALQHNEFLGQNFCPELSTTESSGCPSYVICTGEEFLAIQGIDLSPWGLWQNHVALAVMIFVFSAITYAKLLFLKKHS